MMTWIRGLVPALVFAVGGAAFADTARPVPGLILPLHEVEVGTAVAGIVAEVLVQEGQTVAQGDVLARLEDAMEKLDVERAARILEKARFDHEATQKLFSQNVATKEAALAKKIDFELAGLQLRAAEERLRQRTIRAPLQGIVVRREKEPGEAVLLNETVVQIVHIQEVYAQFYLEPAQAGGLSQGQQVTLRVPSLPAAATITGVVHFMDPRMDAESGLYRVKVKLQNPGLLLKAGMRVEAELAGRP